MTNSQNEVITLLYLSVDSSVVSKPSFVYAKQYDVRSRYLKVLLLSSDGAVPVSGRAQLNAVLPDGERVYVPGVINSDYSIDFALKSRVLSLAGNVVCDVSVFKEEGEEQSTLTSSSFNIVVDASQYSADAWEGEDVPPADFSEVVAAVSGYAQDAMEAAQNAQDSATQISVAVDRVSDMVDDGREYAQKAEEAAQMAKDAASSSKTYSENIDSVIEELINDKFTKIRDEGGFISVSPTVNIEKNNNTTTIAITDIDGTKVVEIMDGEEGQPGEPGLTPVKGVDYFTEADKEEMVARIINSLSMAEKESV